MRVEIDGIEYVPVAYREGPTPFALTWDHWELAKQHSSPFEAIKWAWECEATPTEFAAWIRASAKDSGPEIVEPTPKRGKVAPLVMPPRKPQAGLF